jgi:RimJ/RimL family protein N-acetyltransferase
MKPILLDFPEQFESERLLIRCPRAGDGKALNDAVRESIRELRPWMPWAQTLPSISDSEETLRQARKKFLDREELWLLLFLKGADTLVGSSGLHDINWNVPRFEIGYWRRTSFAGQGYVTEAVNAIAAFCFDKLRARRVQITIDDRNERSWRVAERCGFTLEGVLRNYSLDVNGKSCNMRMYARTV